MTDEIDRPVKMKPDITGKTSTTQTITVVPKKKPFLLEQVMGPGVHLKHQLKEPRVLVGRSDEAEIQMVSREVSRKHILLVRTEDEYKVVDLESRNGVYLNGVQIHSAVLHDGDTVQIGDVVFIYHQGT